METYTLRATVTTATPEATAQAFQVMLALEKGYTSVIRTEGAARVVVASDGQAIRFERGN